MAEATVTYKLRPSEHTCILNALTQYRKFLGDTIKTMAPADGRGLRSQLLIAKDTYDKLAA